MLRSIGKQSRESVSQSERRKGRLRWEGFAEKESGELMELMEEVPLKELGDAILERLVRG